MDRSIFTLHGVRWIVLPLGLLSLLQAAATIGQAWWLAQAVTMLFYGHHWTEALSFLLLFWAAFGLRHTFNWLSRLISGNFAEKKSETLQCDVLHKLFMLGPRHTAKVGSGQLVTLLIDGTNRFRTYLERFIPRSLDMLLVTPSLLVAIYMLDVLSGLILTFTMPILIIFFVLLGKAAKTTADKQWKSYQVLADHFTDTLRGLETLRFLGHSKDYTATVENTSNRYRKATMRTLRVAFLSSLALDVLSTLSVAFVAVGLGLRLIDGSIDLKPALAVLLLAPDYFQPVRMLGSDYHASLDGKEAWKSFRKIIRQAPRKKLPATTAPILADMDAARISLSLKDVYVAGEKEGSAPLAHISLNLDKRWQKIGIVGESGAGKTTLLNVLSGFLEPDSGVIMMNGSPLKGEFMEAWQKQLAYIPQHPHLFSASLADNVRFYEPEATDDMVLAALRAVGLAELVSQLPHGIHERIGEGFRNLSGGQAQRVALARALVGNRTVWLLDEPTAHLDIETEWELKQTMLALFKNRKVFLATHRLHWMKEMDWILVLKNGSIVEQGPHEELISRQGVYRSLFETASLGRERRT